MFDRFRETLKGSGYSLTSPRQRIFEFLSKSGPITAAQLSEQCMPEIDRATVYRTIELFERLGILNRIWHGFKSQIELSEIFTPHHHHALCQHCGTSIDIMSSELESLLARIARQHQFLALGHTLELSGYCEACQLK